MQKTTAEPIGDQAVRQTLVSKGYDFSRSVRNITNKRFVFGPRNSEAMAVDATLANLFDCLTVECSGILVQPQWKHFRHIKLVKNDQYRLSNGIWRSWHIQFQKGRKPRFCQFDIDPHLQHHTRQQLAVVVEGKYWKRKVEAVAQEYRKWRCYYKERNRHNNYKKPPFIAELLEHALGDELGGGPKSRAMQVDPARGFLQSLEEIPDTLNMDFSRDSHHGLPFDRGAMQPNLDMLNPTLDELLDKLEPMEALLTPFYVDMLHPGGVTTSLHNEVMLSRTMGYPTPLPATYNVTPSQQPPSLGAEQYPLAAPTPMQTGIDYPGSSGLLSQFSTPPKPFQHSQLQNPFGGQINYGATRSSVSDQPFNLSPSSLLNMPVPNHAKGQQQLEASMEVGVPNYPMKPEPPLESSLHVQSCTHQQSGMYNPNLVSYQPQQGVSRTPPPLTQGSYTNSTPDSIYTGIPMETQQQKAELGMSSLLNQWENQLQSPSLSHTGGGSTPLSHVTPTSRPLTPHAGSQGTDVFQFPLTMSPSPPIQPRPDMPPPLINPFGRVSSAGNLGAETATSPLRPPLERGKSEPSRYLQEQVRKLNEQSERQMKEIEKQQNLAQQQYSELLQQYLHQMSGKPTQQQQQALQSVLSDPSLVTILKSVLLSGEGVSAPSLSSPPMEKPAVSLSTPTNHPQVLPQPHQAAVTTETFSSVVSPTQLAKVTGVSDFQSRLLVAAAAQANNSNPAFATPTSNPTTPVTSLMKYPLSKEFEFSPSPKLVSFNQPKFKGGRSLSSEDKEVYKEMRRQSHITAEQKRRGSIKHGFDQLQSLVINLSSYPSGKVSKAAILEKTIEHIRHIHQEREHRERRTEALKCEIEELNAAISHCQEQLPASGVPVTRQRFEENRQHFREYVQTRTLQNYKFWIFSIILQQLFDSYNSMVSTGNSDELCRTTLAWFEQNCSLPALRPVVMNSLRELSMKTSILSDPSQVPHQLTEYAKQDHHEHSQDMRHLS